MTTDQATTGTTPSSTSTSSRTALLGPLTTTFTPPDECAWAFFLSMTATAPTGVAAQTCDGDDGGGGNANADATGCWPAGAFTTSASLFGGGFYSPGLVCPSGYATACSATAGEGGRVVGEDGWSTQFALVEGETAVGCCPRWVPDALGLPFLVLLVLGTSADVGRWGNLTAGSSVETTITGRHAWER